MSDGYEEECLSCGFSTTDMRRWKFRAEDMRDKAKLLEERIAELEKEAAQWQESSGQNYVRACEAEAREDALRQGHPNNPSDEEIATAFEIADAELSAENALRRILDPQARHAELRRSNAALRDVVIGMEEETGRLIKAMTDDVSAARACCGRTEPLRRCSSYVQRGRTCPNCPMEWVSGCSKALNESGE